jgi:hypothetical protein
METNADIQAVIRWIDQKITALTKKIEALRETKDTLIREFGSQRVESPGPAPSVRKNGKPRERVTRREQLIRFLQTNGPTPWRELLAGLGMPKGTLGFLLNTDPRFTRDEDGRWTLRNDAKAQQGQAQDHDDPDPAKARP